MYGTNFIPHEARKLQKSILKLSITFIIFLSFTVIASRIIAFQRAEIAALERELSTYESQTAKLEKLYGYDESRYLSYHSLSREVHNKINPEDIMNIYNNRRTVYIYNSLITVKGAEIKASALSYGDISSFGERLRKAFSGGNVLIGSICDNSAAKTFDAAIDFKL